MTTPAKSPDVQDRLVLSRNQVAWRAAGQYFGFATAGLVLVILLVVGLLAAKLSVAAVVVGLLVLAVIGGFTVYLYVAGLEEAHRQRAHFPVIAATEASLILAGPAGERITVQRAHLASVVRLTSAGVKGSRIQFRDEAGKELGHWDLGWMAPATMRWLSHLGYPTSQLGGQAALAAAVSGVHGPPGPALDAADSLAGSAPTGSLRREVGDVVGGLVTAVGVMFVVISAAWVLLLGTGLKHGSWGTLGVVAAIAAAVTMAGGAVSRAATGRWLSTMFHQPPHR